MPETAASPSSSGRSRPSKQYRCSLCDKPFDSAETLDSHQRFEHSEPGYSKPVAGVGWYKFQLSHNLMSMPTAFVLINYEFGTEKETINKLKTVPGVIEASEVNGVYDIFLLASFSLAL